jgi:hypothetical protein
MVTVGLSFLCVLTVQDAGNGKLAALNDILD